MIRLFALSLVPAAAIVACNTSPTEPPTSRATAAASPADAGTTTTSAIPSQTAAATPPAPGGPEAHGGDPLAGQWTMADATKGLTGTGPLKATLDTSNGPISCKLYDDKAPVTVANFVGLARGLRPFKDQKAGGTWVTRPAYDGTTFHRVIKGFMIQGGDPAGNGMGEPGYTIKDEIWPGAKHDRAGLLCMANRGHNTNGQQFFIIDTPDPQKGPPTYLDGNYTIFGECSPEKTIHDIASVPLSGEKPVTPVVIKTVTISRAAK